MTITVKHVLWTFTVGAGLCYFVKWIMNYNNDGRYKGGTKSNDDDNDYFFQQPQKWLKRQIKSVGIKTWQFLNDKKVINAMNKLANELKEFNMDMKQDMIRTSNRYEESNRNWQRHFEYDRQIQHMYQNLSNQQQRSAFNSSLLTMQQNYITQRHVPYAGRRPYP